MCKCLLVLGLIVEVFILSCAFPKIKLHCNLFFYLPCVCVCFGFQRQFMNQFQMMNTVVMQGTGSGEVTVHLLLCVTTVCVIK